VTLDRIFNLLGLIVILAIITTLVAHRNTIGVVQAASGGFIGSLRAAMGR
jgi:hypothetical protein